MTLIELKDMVDRMWRTVRQPEEVQVCVRIISPGSAGGTPTTGVKFITLGGDWDKNKLIFTPDDELHRISADEKQSLQDSLRDIGWTAYEFTRLQHENKRLRRLLDNADDT